MSGILNSGKLATLLSRLTAARAGYLDNLTKLDATISGVLAAGGYTSARAAKLDYLDGAVSGVGSSPPTTNGLKGISTTASITADNPRFSALGSGSTSTYNVWTTVLTDTGAGVINFLSVYQTANTSTLDIGFRFSIDGNVVATTADNLITGVATPAFDGLGIELVGVYSSSGIGLASIPFNTSFTVEMRKNTNSAGTITCECKGSYYLTA